MTEQIAATRTLIAAQIARAAGDPEALANWLEMLEDLVGQAEDALADCESPMVEFDSEMLVTDYLDETLA